MPRTFLVPAVTFLLGLSVGGAVVARASQSPDPGTPEPLVTGIGGVFFKAKDPGALRAWYRQHLGIESPRYGKHFLWREDADPDRLGITVWGVFPATTKYFGPGGQTLMINYRVRDLDAVLAKLASAGVRPVAPVYDGPDGRFAHVEDGEGNRIELWQPPHYSRERYLKEVR